MPRELLQIGAVCRPHGLGGELRIRLHNPMSVALDGLKRIWLTSEDGELNESAMQAWKIRSARRLDGGFYLLALEGLADRSGAEALREHILYAERSALPVLAADEFYVADLVGCRVLLSDGQEIGTAKEIQDLGGNRLLVVERPQRADALVPMVPSILVAVDLTNRVLCIDPPEGLLELDVA